MKGLITKSTGLWYQVSSEDKKYNARLKGKFKLENKKLTNPIAVGDRVEFELNEQVEDEWVITNIYPRENYVLRESPRKKGYHHIIASNIDQGILIVTLKMPRTSIGFVDRFLISLEAFRIPGIIIFNKSDIYSSKDLSRVDFLKGIYEKVGYRVLITSFNNDPLDNVKSLLLNKISLLSGHSGAGKSTLINRFIPQANQEVQKVSSFAGKGVHTTTFAELFELNKNTKVIDTPGIKELGLAEIENEELSHYFPEMRKYLGKCKFNNCLHDNEPDCAIKERLGKDISAIRYDSYLSTLKNEDNRK
ncbi:MAG: ribosome small subunit-dependent GTPase A [Ekhidna sp.]|nr:ribosome small subunit-dependent GTPase A [Ekhidna sp.]